VIAAAFAQHDVVDVEKARVAAARRRAAIVIAAMNEPAHQRRDFGGETCGMIPIIRAIFRRPARAREYAVEIFVGASQVLASTKRRSPRRGVFRFDRCSDNDSSPTADRPTV
jgi:hypothetical protein